MNALVGRSDRLRAEVEASGYVWRDCSQMSDTELNYFSPMIACGSERAEIAERRKEGRLGRWVNYMPEGSSYVPANTAVSGGGGADVH